MKPGAGAREEVGGPRPSIERISVVDVDEVSVRGRWRGLGSTERWKMEIWS
jgi:hypothetical protein